MVEEKHLLAGLLAPAVIVFVATVTLNLIVYGIALPNAGYIYLVRGANPAIYNNPSGTPFTREFYQGLLGIIFDKNWGLITTAPIFILALAGFGAFWKLKNDLFVQVIVISGLYFIAVAGMTLWRGGPTPTPRFLVPVLPLFALPLAAVYEACQSKGLKMLACALLALGLSTSLASLTSLDADYIPSRLAAHTRDAYGFTITSMLPSIDQHTPETFWLTITWIFIVCGLAWWVSATTRVRNE